MAVFMFLTADGIEGEIQSTGHEGAIEVFKYDISVAQPSSSVSASGGIVGGQADFGNLMIEKIIDKTTPNLALYCASGKPIAKVQLDLCEANEDKTIFMSYILEGCMITKVEAGGESKTEEIKPLETISFAYGKITWEYTPTTIEGSTEAAIANTWNLATHAKE